MVHPDDTDKQRFIADCNLRRAGWSGFQKSARRAAERLVRHLYDEQVDSNGEPFVDGAEYTDRHGDTWRAAFDASEFLHVKRADETTPSTDCVRWCEDIHAVARDFGPMTPVDV